MDKSQQVTFNICTMENTASKEKQRDPACWEVSRDSSLHTASAGRAAIPRDTGWGTSGCSCEGLTGLSGQLGVRMIHCKNVQGDLGVQEETCTRFCLLFVHRCSQSLQHPAVPLTAESGKSEARWALKPPVAQVTALPVSCCQCLQLWNHLVLCNDSIWSHFSMRGTVGPLVWPLVYLISLNCVPVPSL